MKITQRSSPLLFDVYSSANDNVYFVNLADKGDGNKRGTCDCWHFLDKCEPNNRRDGIGRSCKHIRECRRILSSQIQAGQFDASLMKD